MKQQIIGKMLDEETPKQKFEKLCYDGKLKEAKCLLTLQKNVNNDINISTICQTIRTTSYYGHLNIIKWLFNVLNEKYISFLQEEIENIFKCVENAFKSSCYNGKLKVAKWLLKNSNKLLNYCYLLENGKNYVNYVNDVNNVSHIGKEIINKNNWLSENVLVSSFSNSCENGHLKTSKWLLQLITQNNVVNDKFIYTHMLCCPDYKLKSQTHIINIAKWLLLLSNDNNYSISIDFENSMRQSSNSLKCQKWLLKNKPTINILANKNYLFNWNFGINYRFVCYNHKYKNIHYILLQKPQHYFYTKSNICDYSNIYKYNLYKIKIYTKKQRYVKQFCI